MKTTKAITISLPPEMLAEAKEVASEENRTLSDLFREAFRRYMWMRRWDRARILGETKAREAGAIPDQLEDIVDQYRQRY